MKKISTWLLIFIILNMAIVSIWVYVKLFSEEDIKKVKIALTSEPKAVSQLIDDKVERCANYNGNIICIQE